jgi:site-specific DNA-methyltransferase (adenine-specific)
MLPATAIWENEMTDEQKKEIEETFDSWHAASDCKLLRGDCLDVLKEVESGSVDMVLGDLPYGTTACKWDVRIPFEQLWKELHRVCKTNAAMVMFGSEPFSSLMRMSNIGRFKYDWIWKKKNPSNYLHAKNRPLGIHETISVFSEFKDRYYPQGLVKIDKRVSVPDKTNNRMFGRSNKPRKILFQEFTNYPRTILEYSKETGHHTSQKPVALLEYLIKTYTNEGDTVLDPTMGSGSTGVACKNLGRKFIGIEMDAGYFDIAKRRIDS